MERDVVIKEWFMNIIEKIKTFEDAMAATGRTEMPDFSTFPAEMRKHFEALFKMVVIVEALNEGWKPDVCDKNVCRWYPWFRPNGSPGSFAFCGSVFDNGYANAGSGSRLVLKSKELADYCGMQFVELWKEMLL